MATPKVILITGANGGIGYEAVRAFLKSSTTYNVLLCGRSLQKAHDAAAQARNEFPQNSSTLTPLQLDVTDDDSITRAFEHVQSSIGHVDALVNNAGASFDGEIIKEGSTLAATRKHWNESWNTNVTGSNIVTHVFAPLLLKSSDPRLMFLTSGLASCTNLGTSLAESNPKFPANAPPQAGWPKPLSGSSMAYRSTKVGLNMVMLEWYRTLKNDGVKVWCISPGLLATNLGGNPEFLKKIGAQPASIGGEFIRDVVEGKRDVDVGKVVFSGGSNQPW